MIKLGRHGVLKSDVKDVYFDNQDYEITICLDIESHPDSDEIYIYCDTPLKYYWNVFKVRVKLFIF